MTGILPSSCVCDVVRKSALNWRGSVQLSHGVWLVVLLFSFFFSSCGDEKKQTGKEESLDSVVAQIQQDLREERVEALAAHFIAQSEDQKKSTEELAKSIVNSKFTFKVKNSKVSGDMGVVIVSFNQSNTQYAYYAQRVDKTWKFYINSILWVDRQQLASAKLPEQNMKDAMILHDWVVSQTQVGASGIGAYERLAWYLPWVPKSLTIEKFYETPVPASDYEYMWKIKISKTPEFMRFEKQITGKPSNASGEAGASDLLVSQIPSHPAWWRNLDLEHGERYRYYVNVVGGGGEKAYLYALIDRNSGYLYIQAGGW